MRRSLRNGWTIFIVMLVAAVVFCGFVSNVLLPNILHIGVALPVISVPGEKIPGTPITNTIVGTILADIVVLLFAFFATRNIKEVPGRLQSVFEMIVQFLDNLARTVAGPRSRKIFPLMATVFIFVLIANWLELIPGVDSIGVLECAAVGQNGYNANGAVLVVNRILDSGKAATAEDHEACEKHGQLSAEEQHRADLTAKLDADPKAALSAEEASLVTVDSSGNQVVKNPLRPNLHVVTSFVRAAATDLNLTLALAVIAFCAIEFFGIQAHGGAYFYKFINIPALDNITNPKVPMVNRALEPINFAVGFLELISELARILSFGFRLFGNIFAGQVLLFVMTFLLSTLFPVIFYGLELFTGVIQAFVFAMLITVFSAMAMAGHDDSSHGEHEAEGAPAH